LLKNGGTILNIISNAAIKPMTNSAIYNSSKAGSALLTKQMARELTQHYDITVFGISPNKVVPTKMSDYVDDVVPILRGWSKEFAKRYELANTPCKEYTDLEVFTDYIIYLLSEKINHKFLNGNIIEYGV
jgi:NAD(P)-dependent dehydrogenase (short-subunit alcohol dehydrogenase family)